MIKLKDIYTNKIATVELIEKKKHVYFNQNVEWSWKVKQNGRIITVYSSQYMEVE